MFGSSPAWVMCFSLFWASILQVADLPLLPMQTGMNFDSWKISWKQVHLWGGNRAEARGKGDAWIRLATVAV